MALIFTGASVGALFLILLLCKAFQQSFGWGFGCLFLPFLILLFVAFNWRETRRLFLLMLLAVPITLAGAILAGS